MSGQFAPLPRRNSGSQKRGPTAAKKSVPAENGTSNGGHAKPTSPGHQ